MNYLNFTLSRVLNISLMNVGEELNRTCTCVSSWRDSRVRELARRRNQGRIEGYHGQYELLPC